MSTLSVTLCRTDLKKRDWAFDWLLCFFIRQTLGSSLIFVNSFLASKGKHCWEIWGGTFRLGLSIENISAAIFYVNESYKTLYIFSIMGNFSIEYF
jgi:hypothetical protein